MAVTTESATAYDTRVAPVIYADDGETAKIVDAQDRP